MKRISTILASTLLSLGAFAQNTVTSPLVADITKVLPTEGHFLAAQAGTIALEGDTATLTLMQPKRFCFRAPCPQPADVIVALPIVSITQSCGSVIYTAREDQRPVDGVLRELVIQDNAHRACRDLRPAMTEISYTVAGYNRIEGNEFNYTHQILAKALKSPLAPNVFAFFDKLDIAPGHFEGFHVDSANVFIRPDANTARSTITLEINDNAALQPVTKVFSDVQKIQGNCGETVYTAKIVYYCIKAEGCPTPETIKVIDNRTSVCERVYPYMTEVEYSRLGQAGISRFYAEGGLNVERLAFPRN